MCLPTHRSRPAATMKLRSAISNPPCTNHARRGYGHQPGNLLEHPGPPPRPRRWSKHDTAAADSLSPPAPELSHFSVRQLLGSSAMGDTRKEEVAEATRLYPPLPQRPIPESPTTRELEATAWPHDPDARTDRPGSPRSDAETTTRRWDPCVGARESNWPAGPTRERRDGLARERNGGVGRGRWDLAHVGRSRHFLFFFLI
jgi:hypothetical protein